MGQHWGPRDGGWLETAPAESDWVFRELSAALEHDLPVLPVVLDTDLNEIRTSLPSELPEPFEILFDMNAVPLRSGRDIDNDFRLVAATIHKLARPAPVPKVDSRQELLIRFLTKSDRRAFNAARIKHWGGKKLGVRKFRRWSTEEIEGLLRNLVTAGRVTTMTGRRGGTLFGVPPVPE